MSSTPSVTPYVVGAGGRDRPSPAPESVPADRTGGPSSGLRRRAAGWWRRHGPGVRYSLVVYALTRLAVMVGVVAYHVRHPRDTASHLAGTWDGWWYVHIAANGYSRSLRPPLPSVTNWHHGYSDWAFFPGYPLLVRAVHEVVRLPYMGAAIVLSVVLGWFAVWAVYRLGEVYQERLGGTDVARGAALLVAAWPGSAVFGQPYSEGLYVAAAAVALALLLRRRWILAGLAGAVASATRPTGLALVVAAGAAAVVHVVRMTRQVPQAGSTRRWLRPAGLSALAAPVLTAGGAAAFALYGWLRTGDPQVWRHAENLWNQRFDASHKLLTTWLHTATHLTTALRTEGGREVVATTALGLGGCVALLVLLAAVWVRRRSLGVPLVGYAAVTLFMIIGYSAVGPRPRTLLAVIPAFVWVAAWWPRRLTAVAAVGATLLAAVVTYLWLWRVTP